MKKTNLVVIYGGFSTEHDISVLTGEMIMSNLDQEKYNIIPLYLDKNRFWHFGSKEAEGLSQDEMINQLSTKEADVAFIALHGVFGEDGQIQAILESIGLPYTGSGVAASKLAMDKYQSNKVYESFDFAVPAYQLLTSEDDDIKIKPPLVVKPNDGGSSVGITIVKDEKDLAQAVKDAFKSSAEVMVQEYICGREFTCGILEDETGEPLALLPIEITPKISDFFDYKAKYEVGGAEETVNPEIGENRIKELQALTLRAHQALGCRGFSRTDFIEKDNTFYIIETNTIPGMTKNSLLPKSTAYVGISFPELLDRIIQNGINRKI